MHFIEISNIFKSEKKRYKVTAVLKLLVMFALLCIFGMFLDGICNSL